MTTTRQTATDYYWLLLQAQMQFVLSWQKSMMLMPMRPRAGEALAPPPSQSLGVSWNGASLFDVEEYLLCGDRKKKERVKKDEMKIEKYRLFVELLSNQLFYFD